MGLTVMPQRRAVISQDKLKLYISLQNAIQIALRQRDGLEAELFDALLGGAAIEPGVHMATLEEKRKGSKRIQRLRVS